MASPGEYQATIVLVAGEEMIELEAGSLPTLSWGGSGTEVIALSVPLAPLQSALAKLRR